MNNIDQKIEEFNSYYHTNLGYYNEALSFLIQLINTLPQVESVTGRVKDYDECLSKFERKYAKGIPSSNKSFKIFDYLTDFIGIRVICLYSRDVKSIRRELSKYFREVAITDKTIQIESTDDKFGYKSLHLDLAINDKYNKNPEFSAYSSIRFELQIRTIIQDAWSVLDHKIKYKKSIPQSLKRRINRLAALFEIADDEFLRIDEEITMEEKKISDRLKMGDAAESNKPLDVFRFLFVALKHFPDYNFIEFKVDGFVQEILEIKEGFTEGELNRVLENYLHTAEDIARNEKKALNPYTKIRYCLYLSDRKLFSAILSPYQRKAATHRK